MGLATNFSVLIELLVGFANIFTIIEPSLSSSSGIIDTLTMIGGPLIFGLAGFLLYSRYEKIYK